MLSGKFSTLQCALGLLLGAIVFPMTACSGGRVDHDYPWMIRIPNTEHILGTSGSMYVSPGEEWITFLEGDEEGTANGLATVELVSGRRIKHHIEEVPTVERDPINTDPYLELQANRADMAGWYEGMLYLEAPAGRAYVIDNSEPVVTIGSMPRGQKMFSDGPGLHSWFKVLEKRPGGKIAINDGFDSIIRYSAAWRDGRYDATTYAYDSDSDSIVAREKGHNELKIADFPRAGFDQRASLTIMRVSPDEAYLAYVASFSRDLALSPWMLQELHVVDLETGKDRMICSFRIIGNLYWSTDCRRLYLSGRDSRSSHSAYIADISIALGSE